MTPRTKMQGQELVEAQVLANQQMQLRWDRIWRPK
jgi:hypothetical protein